MSEQGATRDGFMRDDEGQAVPGQDDQDLRLRRLRNLVFERVFGDANVSEFVGRYEITRPIGSGGMGTVYEARDPQLERKVAIKLLNWTRGSAAESKRLAREAKALARLSHPNVVQVYDSGTYDDQVFVTMELIHGTDLRTWLAERRRSVREIVQVFVAAGRGLAAAHAAGLVHRDFKPENVLVATDGAVKVVDFGLVSGSHTQDQTRTITDPTEPASTGMIETLSRTGACMGTPVYMSLEQHLGLPTDPRTDQFSFCVALYEALYGERPFRATSLHALADEIRSDRVAFPRSYRVGSRLRAVLYRGLRARPEDRYPDMPALLERLARTRHPVGPMVVVGTVVVMMTGLVVGVIDERRDRCDEEAIVAEVWNDDVRARIEGHLRTVGGDYGSTAADLATSRLDAYTEAWRPIYGETCDASSEEPAPTQLARQLCLQWRLQEMASVVEVLEDADEMLARNVPQILAALPPPNVCAQDRMLPPTIDQNAPRELRTALVRARALWHAGRVNEAFAQASEVAARARHTEMLVLDAEFVAGQIVDDSPSLRSHRDEMRSRLQAALRTAQTHGESIREARLAVLLADSPADDTFESAKRELAAVEARVLGSQDPEAMWLFHNASAMPFLTTEPELRRAHMRKLLEIATEHFGPGHRYVVRTDHLARREGLLAFAIEDETARRDQAETMFGSMSPRAAEAAQDLASALMRDGKHAEALIEYEHARVLWAALVGERSTQVGQIWRTLALIHWRSGAYDQALVAFDQAIAALSDNPSFDHRGEDDVLCSTTMSKADLLLELDRPAEAMVELERAREFGSKDGRVWLWSTTAAEIELANGRVQTSLDSLPDPANQEIPSFMRPTIQLRRAEIALALQRPDEAIEALVHARNEVRETSSADDPELQWRIARAEALAYAANGGPASKVREAAEAALAIDLRDRSSPRIRRERKALEALLVPSASALSRHDTDG